MDSYANRITTRLCHDLANPLGAIGNGLELLELSGLPDTDEVTLIKDSLSAAQQRLKIFRIAFGRAQTGASSVRATDLAALWNFGSKLKIQPGPAVPDDGVNLQFSVLMLMCIETAMPFGGAVIFSGTDQVIMSAQTDRLLFDAELWKGLRSPRAELPDPSKIHFATLAELAQQQARSISFVVAENELQLSV